MFDFTPDILYIKWMCLIKISAVKGFGHSLHKPINGSGWNKGDGPETNLSFMSVWWWEFFLCPLDCMLNGERFNPSYCLCTYDWDYFENLSHRMTAPWTYNHYYLHVQLMAAQTVCACYLSSPTVARSESSFKKGFRAVSQWPVGTKGSYFWPCICGVSEGR